MSIKDVMLRKGMSREKANLLLKENGVKLELVDDEFEGVDYKHNWKCECGEVIRKRVWKSIKSQNLIKCKKCKYQEIEERYKQEVEKDGEYEYIRSFRKDDKLPNNKIAKEPYIKIRHKYCGNVYEVRPGDFINEGSRCTKCCKKYENSIAYHIEQDLGESLDKYWDFEKNNKLEINPYYINKGSIKKVWIKCAKHDYHGSYETECRLFSNGFLCPYCANQKIHPKDSFAQYHIDNTDKDFLTKYWSDKNTIDPFTISPNSGNRVWIKCQEKEYHNDYGGYEASCDKFTSGRRCGYCKCKINKIHFRDSFGYHNFDKVLSWHSDNKISPFRVANNSGKKFKFRCETCEYKWITALDHINRGRWCPECTSSKGEKRICEWLRYNNINYEPQKEFEGLLGTGGGNLSYDFYLPDYNVLIEYQGQYHDGSVSNQTKEQYKKQLEHDRRKKQYKDEHNIRLIEIWHSDFDNIEKILEKEISKK